MRGRLGDPIDNSSGRLEATVSYHLKARLGVSRALPFGKGTSRGPAPLQSQKDGDTGVATHRSETRSES